MAKAHEVEEMLCFGFYKSSYDGYTQKIRDTAAAETSKVLNVNMKAFSSVSGC